MVPKRKREEQKVQGFAGFLGAWIDKGLRSTHDVFVSLHRWSRVPFFSFIALLGLAFACSSTSEGPAQPDAGADGAADGGLGNDGALPDAMPPDAALPKEQPPVVLPLGETLFFDGDDYLYVWGLNEDPVTLVSAPSESAAMIEDNRLTPDVPGTWVLQRGDDTVEVTVEADYLSGETFENYNYSPTQPLAKESDTAFWVAAPQSNAVQRVVVDDGVATAEPLVPVGSWPVALAYWESEKLLLVSMAGRDALGFVDVESGAIVDAIRVGDEPAGLVLDLGGQTPIAYIALSGESRVAKVDLETRAVVAKVEVGRDTRSITLDPTRNVLYAASLLSGNAHPQGLAQKEPLREEEQRDIAVIDLASFSVSKWYYAVSTLLRGVHFDVRYPDRLMVAASDSNNTIAQVEADSSPHTHQLIELSLVNDERNELNHHGLGTLLGASPHTLAYSPDGETLFVTLSAARAVAAFDAQTLEGVARRVAATDPRGLIYVGGYVWTTNWLDSTVQGWSLEGFSVLGDQSAQVVQVGRDPRPESLRIGQRLFNDAEFSKNNDFSCNNCHIDGVTDGLVWNILLDGDVNTIAFRNIGGTRPFLWNGLLPTLFDFSREVLRLVGAQATGEQMRFLTEYMQSVTIPPNPYTLPGGQLTDQGRAGKDVFFKAACTGCHNEPLFTTREVVEGKTDGIDTDVPTLVGAWDSGPWGRQASWDTMEAMVERAVDYTKASLTEQELEALTDYVRQIPADTLYVSSARPLDGADPVSPQTDIEILFSEVLAPAQGAGIVFEKKVGDAWEAVDASLRIDGRRLRVEPASALERTQSYRTRVPTGLRSRFGKRLKDELVLSFHVGEAPGTDVTGKWNLVVRALGSSATALVSFIQSEGGHVNGVVLDAGGAVDTDHMTGHVVGTTFYIDGFLASTQFGPIMVPDIEAAMTDSGDDGLADHGMGSTTILGQAVEFELIRANP